MFGVRTKQSGSRHMTWTAVAALLFGVAGGTPAEDSVEIVLPGNAKCFEGSSNGNPDACAQTPSPSRFQAIADASLFEALRGQPPMQLTELRFRPDGSVDGPRDATYFDTEIYLSVTNREPCFGGDGCMSYHGDENRAPEEGTLVFAGDWSTSTQNVAGCGTAKEFDYVLHLQQPFPYHPDDGNLLLDFAYQSCEGSATFDVEAEDSHGATVVGVWCRDFDVTSPGACTGSGERGSFHGGRATEAVLEPIPMPPAGFVRGDCSGDGTVVGTVTDATSLLGHLFLGAAAPPCRAACDANGDGALDIADPIYVLSFNFLGGSPPVAPYPLCGLGELPSDGILGCKEPLACADR